MEQLDQSVSNMNMTLHQLTRWSNESSLALNPKKTKCMLISTPQMARRHMLHDKPVNLHLEGKSIERIMSTKLLGVKLAAHFDWKEHVAEETSSCYATLSVLRKLKNFAFLHYENNWSSL